MLTRNRYINPGYTQNTPMSIPRGSPQQYSKDTVGIYDISKFGRVISINGTFTANQSREVLGEASGFRNFLNIRCVTGILAVGFGQLGDNTSSPFVLTAGSNLLLDAFVPQDAIYLNETGGAAASFVLAYSVFGG
jgi:hypothetical protein